MKFELPEEHRALRDMVREFAQEVIVPIAAEYDELGDGKSLSRRQRSKMKAAERSYQRPEMLEQYHAERRERQEIRLERVRQEESQLRQSMAERAIAQRQEEQIQQEAERAARSAMNAAFNRGADVEEARAAAQQARAESLLQHGIISEEEQDGETETEGTSNDVSSVNKSENVDANKKGQATPKTAAFMDRLKNATGKVAEQAVGEPVKSSPSQVEATPTTSAFMDRLRQMYDDAVKAKAAKSKRSDGSETDTTEDATIETTTQTAEPELDVYHLSEPDWNEDESPREVRLPKPVAVPTGELADVMKDVITQQQDQPWLVFPEARAPSVKISSTVDGQESDRIIVTPEHQRKQKDISAKLRQDLERKRRAASAWASENDNIKQGRKQSGGKRSNGFTPQKFHSMMTTRQR